MVCSNPNNNNSLRHYHLRYVWMHLPPLFIPLSLSYITLFINFAAYIFKRKFNALKSKIHELDSSLKSSSDQCTSERRGRIKAQQVFLSLSLHSFLILFLIFLLDYLFCLSIDSSIHYLQLLRKELTRPKSENLNLTYYPMIPIGTIQSCFSTRFNFSSFILSDFIIFLEKNVIHEMLYDNLGYISFKIVCEKLKLNIIWIIL